MKLIIRFFREIFFKNPKILLAFYVFGSMIPTIKSYFINHELPNNYLVFQYALTHFLDRTNLYLEYPSQYYDHFYYGVIFVFMIAPFAILPFWLGVFLWNIAVALLMFWVIRKLPFSPAQNLAIGWWSWHNFLISAMNHQSHPIVLVMILMCFVFFEGKKPFFAALMIVWGFLFKLYGIVGLAFVLLYPPQFLKSVFSGIFWAAVLFCLPMIFSSPDYILQCYQDWLAALLDKNDLNANSLMQDYTTAGFLRRTIYPEISAVFVIAVFMFLFALVYFRWNNFQFFRFRVLILCFVCIIATIFSSSAESSTFVIAFTGVSIWFVLSPKNIWNVGLFVGALIFSSFYATDLFPKFLRDEFVRAYSLPALFPSLIMCKILYELLTKKFSD